MATSQHHADITPQSRTKLAEQTFVEILKTANVLNSKLSELFRDKPVTPVQYNILRILRGAHPDALSCGTISERMITSDSDITRVLDRLDKLGLITRGRDANDRRVVKTAIKEEGLRLLDDMANAVVAFHEENFTNLSYGQLELLKQLTETAREGM